MFKNFFFIVQGTLQFCYYCNGTTYVHKRLNTFALIIFLSLAITSA